MSKSTKTLLTYGAIGLFTAAPLVPTILAFVVAAFADCNLNINKSQPCMAWGRNIGGVLEMGLFSGFLLIFTLPVGGIALVIYTLLLAKRARDAAHLPSQKHNP